LIPEIELLAMESGRYYTHFSEEVVQALLAKRYGAGPLFDQNLPTKTDEELNLKIIIPKTISTDLLQIILYTIFYFLFSMTIDI